MAPALVRHLDDLPALCRKHGVRRLDAIGSAIRPDFSAARSDIDLVAHFLPLAPDDAPDRYFGLLHDLEDLLDRPVDLISYAAIRNPYFKQVVDRTSTTLYAA